MHTSILKSKAMRQCIQILVDDIFANIQKFCNGWLRYWLTNTFLNCVFKNAAESLEKHRVSFIWEPSFIITNMLAEVGTSERSRKGVHAQKQKNSKQIQKAHGCSRAGDILPKQTSLDNPQTACSEHRK